VSPAAPERIVIVGASLAGLRGAETLRREGFKGSLTIVGDESHEPYDRPPLSKVALTGWVPPEHTSLPVRTDLGDVDWRLGVAAVGLDREARQVRLADGSSVGYDRVLIATGVRNRSWPDEAQASLEGVRGIRTMEDSRALRDMLDAQPRRVLVVGAGFTGSEVASICRDRVLDVTVVERSDNPLTAALGGVVGEVAGNLQRLHGVDLRCGVTVEALEGDGGHGSGGRGRWDGDGQGGAGSRFRAATLSDGTTIEADMAVITLGAVRNTEWLDGSGLAAGPLGVSCDPGGRAYAVNGMALDDVFAAGDVARFPHALFDYEFLALEHWENALVGAQVAAHNMLHDDPDRHAHVCVPTFWSVQFGTNIKSVGVPALGDQILVTQGSLDDGRFAAAYIRDDRIVAAVTFNQGRYLDHYRNLIEQAGPPPVPVGQAAGNVPVDARFPDPAVPYSGPTIIVSGRSPTEMRAEEVPADR
jgi:NADPH-dependent 2,4-dienoyl-CoA reductase/sulfur reductase-like enzyme